MCQYTFSSSDSLYPVSIVTVPESVCNVEIFAQSYGGINSLEGIFVVDSNKRTDNLTRGSCRKNQNNDYACAKKGRNFPVLMQRENAI